ncbi:hypothetical protein [Streptomyces sp. NPDC058252]|uniref:hypothetical protein n=1 Tax=Streptomyces sp. NPDC058252 TaxID=3346405 RepID=UPI0036E23CB2
MASDRTRRGSEAHERAMKHITMLTEASTELRSEPKIARRLDGLIRGIPLHWDIHDQIQFSKQTLEQVGDLMGEIGVCELWKRNGRVIYDLHEELSDALARSRMGTVPGRLFDQLPHINPMVVLPDPWPAGPGRGTEKGGWVRAFMIFGWVGKALCNTNDPQREGLGVLYLYDVVDEDTGEIIAGGARDFMPLPTGMDKFSVQDAIKHVEQWQGSVVDEAELRRAMKSFRPLLERTFSVITYLCTDNNDVDMDAPPPWMNQRRRKKTGKNRKAQDREPFWVRVGWYVGPKLHESRKRAESARRDGPSIPSGVEYSAQHRAGHFKIVWFGKGKTQFTSMWIRPYWTKLEDLPEGMDPPTQIVPVDPQRKDPLRRRDTIGH